MHVPVPGELWAQVVPPKGHVLVFAGALMSCCSVQGPTRPSLVGTAARLLQKQGGPWALEAVVCASFVSVPSTRLGRRRGGAGGTVLETKPSIVCFPVRGGELGLVSWGSYSLRKANLSPTWTDFLFSAPLENPVTGLPGWTFCDRGGALSTRIARQGGLGAEAAPVLSNPGILRTQIRTL